MQAWLPSVAHWNNRRLAERIDYEKQIHHRRYDRKCNLYTHSGGHAGICQAAKSMNANVLFSSEFTVDFIIS